MYGDIWKENIQWEYHERQYRLKREWFVPDERPIQAKYVEFRGPLANTFRLLFSKGYGPRADAILPNSGHLGQSPASKSRDIVPGEAALWRRAEESGLVYLWDMKTAEQLCDRYASTNGAYPDGTDYLTLMLEGSTGYLRRRTSQELFDIMEEMATWERSSVNEGRPGDVNHLEALEWWFTDRNLGSEFSTDGSQHILLYRENVPPASPLVIRSDLPTKEEYERRKREEYYRDAIGENFHRVNPNYWKWLIHDEGKPKRNKRLNVLIDGKREVGT